LDTTTNNVLEVPDIAVKLSSTRRAWTYGTIGVGVEYGPMIWKEHKHVFSAHTQQTTHVVTTTAVNLGLPNRLKQDTLSRIPVDCLLLEGDEATKWVPLVMKAEKQNRPQMIDLLTSCNVLNSISCA
jgi:hypothetical protein